MTISTGTPTYASPVDHVSYGQYGPGRLHLSPDWNRPLYPFQGRITADGSSGHPAGPGRYHLYAAWVCPYAHRAAIVRKLKGLEDVVPLSWASSTTSPRHPYTRDLVAAVPRLPAGEVADLPATEAKPRVSAGM
ncbi:hypothetical protein [Nonomuraea rubra]|uniref:GST N-terminal domain-containing protein n=1 Tax=Nonomuraea rubra TaxID=46180 RepID=A0A7X0U0Q8_9ACTN|nr:hypothetical protein [Nonomuraea rubra]MBB6550634.1 hypothetical protein [Nonomuraea rubra]